MKSLFTVLIGLLCFVQPASAHAQAALTATDVATYSVTFSSTWSNETHPVTDFPGNAHFSPLIGATHNLSATFWISGTLASPGIEQMAETGRTSILHDEFSTAGSQVGEIIAGTGLGTSPGQLTLPNFRVSHNHPLVTLVTMLAPSPDWFVGVHDLDLRDPQGKWRDEMVITLYPYDAGSDDGTDYTAEDIEPATHQPISRLSEQAPFSSAPIGTFTFTRVRQIYLPLVRQ